MHKTPKVLHIITRLDWGGSALDTITTVDRLRNHNFQTALAFGQTHDPEGSVRDLLAQRQIACFHLPYLVRNPSPWQDLRALRGLKRLLNNERYDLVHTHTSKAGTLGRLAAYWLGIPAVHTPHGHIFYGYFRSTVTAFYVFVERRMARLTTRIISLTDDETRESLERGIGRPEQYVTIPSGVALPLFQGIPRTLGAHFRNTWNIPPEALVFLSIGRLVPIKGFDILLDAFARADFSAGLSADLSGEALAKTEALGAKAEGGSACGGKGKPVFLVIMGDGEQRKSLEALAARRGITTRVRWTGEIRDIRSALSAADAFVLASRNEGQGSVFIEAMAAGLPVIGTAVGGIPSVIRDHHTGLLVAGEDPGALAGALMEMAFNGELRQAMGRNAANSVFPRYDEDTTIARIAALYREVLGAKTRDLPRMDIDNPESSIRVYPCSSG